MSTWVGLDISKDTIDVAFFEKKGLIHFTVKNDELGFKKFLKQIPKESKICMEATGIYFLPFARALNVMEIHVSVENAYKIKSYALSVLRRTKTDKADAKLIAQYAEQYNPAEWKMPSDKQLECQQLYSFIGNYQKAIQIFSNQLHAIQHSGVKCPSAIKDMTKEIERLEKLRKKTETKMLSIIKSEYPEEIKLLSSIPGIGNATACYFLTKFGNLKDFETSGQLASFIGITPLESWSGTSINKRGRISKMGSSRMRKQLFMCALTAQNRNPSIMAMKKRMLENGKHPKKILIASMNKLIRQMFGVIKSGLKFDPHFA